MKKQGEVLIGAPGPSEKARFLQLHIRTKHQQRTKRNNFRFFVAWTIAYFTDKKKGQN